MQNFFVVANLIEDSKTKSAALATIEEMEQKLLDVSTLLMCYQRLIIIVTATRPTSSCRVPVLETNRYKCLLASRQLRTLGVRYSLSWSYSGPYLSNFICKGHRGRYTIFGRGVGDGMYHSRKSACSVKWANSRAHYAACHRTESNLSDVAICLDINEQKTKE